MGSNRSVGAATSAPGGRSSSALADHPARGITPFEIGLFLAAVGVAFGYAASLVIMATRHGWLLDASGRPLPIDFIAIWTAGRLALTGEALSAYDGLRQHAAEVAAIGHDFTGFYGWPYPPSFFLVASTLARLPYAVAFVTGVVVSFTLHGLGVAAITRRAGAVAFAGAAPWALACAMVGQNGFLTAALIGFSLLSLDSLPVLSGVLLGLLTYKPHFGLLFPLALAASGRWRVFGWAAVSALALTALSIAIYGGDVFVAFVHNLPQTTQALVTHGGVGWRKLQSVFGMTRSLGASNAVAWAAQGATSLACALGVFVVWRGDAPVSLKAAALAAAAVLATPYVFAYDLPVLSVAAAFLYRQKAFDGPESVLAGLAALALAPFAFVSIPTGLLASLAIAAIIVRRTIQHEARKDADAGISLPVAP
jgi:arabinofuranan 3-O-arabinosyltransferase